MRGGLAAVLLLSFVAVACAADLFVVEDWTKAQVGTRGLPPEWKAQNWGSPKYEFEIVTDDNQRVLHMKSANEASLASRDIKGKVNLKETPIIEWSWKVTALPKGGDSCKKATDDQAAQVYVVYNEDCEPPAAVSVAIDSNDTGSSAESYVGAIFFKRP